MIEYLKLVLFSLFLVLLSSTNTLAAVDPTSIENSKVGIGLLSPDAEIDEAADLVNTNGDWGYVLITIKKSERNVDRWQSVFNRLNEKHLVPIVRIATEFDSLGFWQRPSDDDAHAWADFLSKLYWPIKNRYVQIYNEVNHADEWGGTVDAADYAKELSKTIKELKNKSEDFFVLNAPLDLALNSSKTSLDAEVFYGTMEASTPGIFKMLDGWASHSYPNPGFSSSPLKSGRLSILGYQWELSLINKLTGKNDFPVFITETGWKRSNGLDEEAIANYYKVAYEQIWTDKRVIAVTPFIFNFFDGEFKYFSFKADEKVLGKKYYSYYETIKNLPKIKGEPHRENKSPGMEIITPRTLINNLPEKGHIVIQNTGNVIWEKGNNFNINFFSDNAEISNVTWQKEKIFPGQKLELSFKVKSRQSGTAYLEIKAESLGQTIADWSSALKSDSLFFSFFEIVKSLGRKN